MNLALPVGSPLKADSARDRVGDWRGGGEGASRAQDSGLWLRRVAGSAALDS